MFAAARQGSRFDHVVRVISLTGQSVPVFVLGLICLLVFGVLHAVAKAMAERVAIDGMLAINAALYLVAALLAKLAMYVHPRLRGARLARYANYFSIAGLLMTFVGTCWLELAVVCGS